MIKARLLRLGLSGKLTAIGVLAAAAALTFASVVLLVADVSLERASLVRDLGTITDVAGINSTATISFGDAKAAAETLSALRVNPQIVTAAILLRDGKVFARFRPRSRPAERGDGGGRRCPEPGAMAPFHGRLVAAHEAHLVGRRRAGGDVRRVGSAADLGSRQTVSADPRGLAVRRAPARIRVVQPAPARDLQAAPAPH